MSVDCFGALDTTRIFVLETKSLNVSERFAVSKMPSHFQLNRIGGGISSNDLDVLGALSEWNKRELR